MYKIGIVSTESEGHSTICTLLKSNGYEVLAIEDKREQISIESLVILGGNQMKFRQVQEWVIFAQEYLKTPIWIFFPQCSEKERDILLQLGVNGIVTKPERINEVAMLIRNYIIKIDSKFTYISANANERGESSLELKDSKLSIIIENGKEVHLTRLEYRLVKTLYENKEEVCTYEMLAQSLLEAGAQADFVLEQNRIANIICKIRAKIARVNRGKFNLIKTVRSRGYMLTLTA
jgi:DNA-binding response OmpR family regulator